MMFSLTYFSVFAKIISYSMTVVPRYFLELSVFSYKISEH